MRKRKFYIYQEELIKIEIDTCGICVTELVQKLNQHITPNMKKLRTTQITDYLIKKGYLQEKENGDRRPTKRGELLGIVIAERENEKNEIYTINIYKEQAQKYIYDHLYDML